ncbi:MAG: hypothetical protein IT350_01690 [Deltaproteobacteria bacterium]|nr:hypothetical protein [Deltaproteobacteria bacterium]
MGERRSRLGAGSVSHRFEPICGVINLIFSCCLAAAISLCFLIGCAQDSSSPRNGGTEIVETPPTSAIESVATPTISTTSADSNFEIPVTNPKSSKPDHRDTNEESTLTISTETPKNLHRRALGPFGRDSDLRYLSKEEILDLISYFRISENELPDKSTNQETFVCSNCLVICNGLILTPPFSTEIEGDILYINGIPANEFVAEKGMLQFLSDNPQIKTEIDYAYNTIPISDYQARCSDKYDETKYAMFAAARYIILKEMQSIDPKFDGDRLARETREYLAKRNYIYLDKIQLDISASSNGKEITYSAQGNVPKCKGGALMGNQQLLKPNEAREHLNKYRDYYRNLRPKTPEDKMKLKNRNKEKKPREAFAELPKPLRRAPDEVLKMFREILHDNTHIIIEKGISHVRRGGLIDVNKDLKQLYYTLCAEGDEVEAKVAGIQRSVSIRSVDALVMLANFEATKQCVGKYEE